MSARPYRASAASRETRPSGAGAESVTIWGWCPRSEPFVQLLAEAGPDLLQNAIGKHLICI